MPDQPANTPESHVFIVTYGRSGSTLLQALLNTIPGVQIRGENQNALYPLFQSWKAIATSPEMQRLRHRAEVTQPGHPWFGAESTDPAAYRTALCRTFAASILQPAAGTRIAGFKEIRAVPIRADFVEYMDFLRLGFPGAQIVFNMRAAAQVAQSSWWRQHDPKEVRAMIARADAAFQGYASAYPECAICLSYEAYVADHSCFDPLFDRIGARATPPELARVMATRLTHAQHSPARPASPVRTWA